LYVSCPAYDKIAVKRFEDRSQLFEAWGEEDRLGECFVVLVKKEDALQKQSAKKEERLVSLQKSFEKDSRRIKTQSLYVNVTKTFS